MTDDTSKDLGLAIVLLQKLTEETLPKLAEIESRLDGGECLDHWDIEFLEDLFRRAEQVKPMTDNHPEYQALYAGVVHLYKRIMDKAMLNEKAHNPAEPGLD